MKTYIKAAASLLAAAALLSGGALHAQDASSSSSSGEPSTEDVLAASIGCIATYDMVLAKAPAGSDMSKVQNSRDFALQVYKEFSQESDEEVANDVQQADALFPDMVAKGTTSLEEFQATCDGVFQDDGTSSAAPAA